MVFGRLTVVSGPVRNAKKRMEWECICTCGNMAVVDHFMLGRGHTQSCGCLQRERTGASRLRHGEARRSVEWDTWNSIKQRCKEGNKGSYKFRHYKGINVCARWLASFEFFLFDMGRRPSKLHSIERKDSTGDYTPDNCKWATRQEQASNKRSNVYVPFNGERLCIAEWSRKTGINASLIRRRIREGWPVEKALFLKSQRKEEAIQYA